MEQGPGGGVVGGYARLVVRLRHVIVLGWVAAVVAATMYLPDLEQAQGGALGSLVPKNAAAVRAEKRSFELFGIPLLTRTSVVQRDPDGLSLSAQRRVFERAVAINQGRAEGLESVAFALPVTNQGRLVPSASEDGTTAITYLFFNPGLGLQSRKRVADRFAAGIDEPGDGLVAVTGAVPARVEQGQVIQDSIPIVELATVGLIALIVGLHFRAPLAPIVTLAAVGISYLIAIRLVATVGTKLGLTVPKEVEPLIVVLLLGIVTDYTIFFMSGLRYRLAAGEDRVGAAERTAANFVPIVFTAGLIVAFGTAALVVGSLGFFRAFGPGLALTTACGLAVAVTFIPAMLALLGRALYWPSLPSSAEEAAEHEAPRRRRRTVAEVVTNRWAALAVIVLCLLALLAGASGLTRTRLALEPIRGLPSDSEARQGAEAAAEGFAEGVLSPTLVMLERQDIRGHREKLERLQQLLATQPGVAGVVGPLQQPTREGFGAVISDDGDAARFIVILNHDPFGGLAIERLRALQDELPRLLLDVELYGARVSVAGDTALAADTVDTILDDLGRIALAVLVANFVLLGIFLRSLVAPLYLLLASVLALAATLGLATYLFQVVLGEGQLTYFVPFTAAVLLVSLGSDYNILVAGRVWQESRERPLREAIAVAVPRASRAITVAGVALAASFGLLAVIPLSSFREFAFTMVAGVLIDAFVVRSFLVPALISLVGEVSLWPGRRLARAR